MSDYKEKADQINELLLSYASGDYHARGSVSTSRDEFDSIIKGINMVGEELLSTTISLDYFSSIYNAVSEMLFVVTQQGIIESVNDSVCNNLDKDRDDLVGLPISALFARTSGNFFNQVVTKLDRNITSFTATEKLNLGDGKQLPVSCSCSRIMDRYNKFYGYLIIMTDISEQLQAERKILKAIVMAQHKEQKRVAEDLHDSLGQELSAVKLYLNSLEKLMVISDPKYQNIYQTVKSILDNAITSLRSICFDLMPASLEYGNIDTALRELLSKLKNQEIINFSYSCPDEIPTLPKNLEIILYRLTQEFINNTIKHAEASNVHVSLSFTKKNLIMKIKDDGKGFDIKKSRSKGRGLKNFHSRIKAYGGTVRLESEINVGTVLRLSFPLIQK